MKYKIDRRKPDRFCRPTSNFGLEIISILRHVVQHDAQNGGGTGDPRENPSTSGIVRNDSHLRKSEGDSARDMHRGREGLGSHGGDQGHEALTKNRGINQHRHRKNAFDRTVLKFWFMQYQKMLPEKDEHEQCSLSVDKDIGCTRKCYDAISIDQKGILLDDIHSFSSKNDQDTFLQGLLEAVPVKHRRPMKSDESGKRSSSFKYVMIQEQRAKMCKKSLIQLYGISSKRARRLQTLLLLGQSPEDMRGQQDNRKSVPSGDVQAIKDHISSFTVKVSHHASKELKYLDAQLDIKKLHTMFKEKSPDSKVKYYFYYKVFKDNFNTNLGSSQIDKTPVENRVAMTELAVHERSNKFYKTMKEIKRICKTNDGVLGPSSDYMHNISLPCIPVQELFYYRQLSVFPFDIHNLKTDVARFFLYHEGQANKVPSVAGKFTVNMVTSDDVLDFKTWWPTPYKKKKRACHWKARVKQFRGARKRGYLSLSMQVALHKTKVENWYIYKASEHYSIPWSMLKDYVSKYLPTETNRTDLTNVKLSRIGKLLGMSSELEVELVSYIVKMQEFGFGLTLNQIRHLAYKSVEQSGSQYPFNKTKEMTGWFWWVNFKSCYGLTLRQPEHLALYRVSTVNREILNDFYTKLENIAESLQVTHLPGRFWNVDETGLTYVMKPNKVVNVVGKKKSVINRPMQKEILELADKNDVHIGTFPSHITHLLQPLDVELYKPLKSNWKKELDALMHSHPGEKPKRVDFNSLLTPSWLSIFIPQTIINSIRKMGIFPIDRCATTDQAIAPSLTNEEQVNPTRDPKAKIISPNSQAGPSSAPDATSYNPTPDATISHQKVLPPKQTRLSKSKQINIKNGKYKDDWFCGSFGRSYNEDVVERMVLNGFSVVFVLFDITVHVKMRGSGVNIAREEHVHAGHAISCLTNITWSVFTVVTEDRIPYVCGTVLILPGRPNVAQLQTVLHRQLPYFNLKARGGAPVFCDDLHGFLMSVKVSVVISHTKTRNFFYLQKGRIFLAGPWWWEGDIETPLY
ncbi:hypothetical protein PR048_007010 [Dryococelus australis]|uniref:Uncharacterized protein n=1 Tax=Dryococelus australis TaxID=614101 RepID=A0ABQ9ICF9_9NEOP|nr:hypothetical protein PR048_007010 [Dryococelus australis]